MTQIGEKVDTYTPPPIEREKDSPPNKKPFTIRIILLCDGTNNNRDNIGKRELNELGVKTQSYSDFGGDSSSYDNGRTNIATMEPHVLSGENKGGYSHIIKFYVPGQGTFNFEKDSKFWGKGMGVFNSGVFQRARECLDGAFGLFREQVRKKFDPSEYYIKQVDIDVFGFSRGAATARHAIHIATELETTTVVHPSGYGAETVITNLPLYKRLQALGYSETRKDQVKIIFAGLYDTVVSVNASQLLPAFIANNTRCQRAVAKARFALHLAAADEHRSDFPLHRITSAKNAGTGAEYYLPGVHSDIGGSYNLANEQLIAPGKVKPGVSIREFKEEGSYSKLIQIKKELEELGQQVDPEETNWAYTRAGKFATEGKLYIIRELSELEYARPTEEVNRVINRGRINDLRSDRKQLIKDGWYKPREIKIELDYLASAIRSFTSAIKLAIAPLSAYEDGSPVSGRLIVTRRNIGTGYCTIPLKFMVEHSRKQSILIDAKLDSRISIILGQRAEFGTLESCLRSYMAKKGFTGSKPSDWNNIQSAIAEYPNIKDFRHDHCHMSSAFTIPVLDPGFTPRFEGELRRRFYYDG